MASSIEPRVTGKSNLSAIDLDATLRAVADANADLATQHRRMMAARDRVPARLATGEQVERAQRYLAMLAESAGRCRRARLADTRPLRAFLARVEGFSETWKRRRPRPKPRSGRC